MYGYRYDFCLFYSEFVTFRILNNHPFLGPLSCVRFPIHLRVSLSHLQLSFVLRSVRTSFITKVWWRTVFEGFSGGSVVKNPPASAGAAGDVGLIPGFGRSPGEDMTAIPVFLPELSRGQRSLAGYSPRSHKELDTTEVTEYTHTHTRLWNFKLYDLIFKLHEVSASFIVTSYLP